MCTDGPHCGFILGDSNLEATTTTATALNRPQLLLKFFNYQSLPRKKTPPLVGRTEVARPPGRP